MPEGPECTIVTNQLDKEVRGWSLVDIKLLTGRYTRKEPDGFYEFMSILILCAHTTYINKVHLLYILFDLDCNNGITLHELLIIFKSIVMGFCNVWICKITIKIYSREVCIRSFREFFSFTESSIIFIKITKIIE